MSTIIDVIDGHEIHESDLMPISERVNPDIIAAGHLVEYELVFEGKVRHAVFFTRTGIQFASTLLDHGGDDAIR
ncbi:hypothetical protein [Brevibacterium sp. UCMA 11754]|uniref:hypothetical protein n=1 Tax=Brevibacterium sp. UCMA 11754 TaxID=2749198 RepID=UPI001F3D6EAF|nr:hypothetical protein [Brevibacterium sp. UCMA 11754]MCF2573146.1 hypothetical protein [Brevibacterium sp. UCMA 11754]